MLNNFIKKQKNKNKGFTLVETLVASLLFTSAMVLGVGALLSALSVSKQAEGARTAIDTISFAVEDMSRNMRLGRDYRSILGTSVTEEPNDGSSQHISFEPVSGVSGDVNDQIVYSIRQLNGSTNYSLTKSIGANGEFFPLTPDDVNIFPLQSGFTVIGSDDSGFVQPRVIIRLSGEVLYRSKVSPFSIQTTISQRAFDGGL